MSDINRIVDVVITKGSRGIESANFSTPLFLTTSYDGNGIVQTFNSYKEVADEYTAGSDVLGAASAHFNQIGNPPVWKVGKWDSANDDLTEALTAIVDVDNDWYGLVVDDLDTPSEIKAAADFAMNYGKFLFTTSDEAAVLTTTPTNTIPDLINGDTLSTKAVCIYNSSARGSSGADAYIDVGFASNILGRTIGSYTGEFKEVRGAVVDTFTGTQRTNMENINVARYNKLAGRDVTENVRVLDGQAEGEYLDIEIGIDWLKNRMEERVFTILINADKIAYTETGIADLTTGVSDILQRGVDNGFLVSFEVKAEPVGVQTEGDRLDRKYNGITWTAILAGAVHSTQINGTVEV